MRLLASGVFGLLLGCGSVSSSPDARTIDGPVADAAKMCAGAFDTPVPLAGFATGVDEVAVSLSPDELTMYISANPVGSQGAHDLYVVQRRTVQEPFDMPMAITAASSAAEEYEPTVSADGLTLIFSSNRITGEGFHLFVSTRTSTLAAFGPATRLGGVSAPNVASNDGAPFLTADGAELWFVSDRTGSRDLYRAVKIGASFGNPVAVPELNTLNGEILPILSADRLTTYFASNRAPSQDFDIWRAQRTTVADGFPAPTQVAELKGPSAERPNWLSSDGCRLYMTSYASGNSDVLVATRRPQ